MFIRVSVNSPRTILQSVKEGIHHYLLPSYGFSSILNVCRDHRLPPRGKTPLTVLERVLRGDGYFHF